MFEKLFDQYFPYYWRVATDELRSGKRRLCPGVVGPGVVLNFLSPGRGIRGLWLCGQCEWNLILGISNWSGLENELDQGETGSRKINVRNYCSDARGRV